MNRRIIDVEKVEGGQKVTQDMEVERILVWGQRIREGKGTGKRRQQRKTHKLYYKNVLTKSGSLQANKNKNAICPIFTAVVWILTVSQMLLCSRLRTWYQGSNIWHEWSWRLVEVLRPLKVCCLRRLGDTLVHTSFCSSHWL